jgi:proteic killer suppression protein
MVKGSAWRAAPDAGGACAASARKGQGLRARATSTVRVVRFHGLSCTSYFMSMPGNRLELLKGNQAGRHSIRVNDRHRVTFRWEHGDADEVRVEDYH